MTPANLNWLTTIQTANRQFLARVSAAALPTQRAPGPQVVITCMDPRVNLEALGIPSFAADGSSDSSVRIIRTVGGMGELRSLVIGTYLAGFQEIALVMHTDCGGCLAFHNIDRLLDNLQSRLPAEQFKQLRVEVGEPFRARVMAWLKVFEEPRAALQREISALQASPWLPPDLIFHGLLYELESGEVNVVVDGYAAREERDNC